MEKSRKACSYLIREILHPLIHSKRSPLVQSTVLVSECKPKCNPIKDHVSGRKARR